MGGLAASVRSASLAVSLDRKVGLRSKVQSCRQGCSTTHSSVASSSTSVPTACREQGCHTPTASKSQANVLHEACSVAGWVSSQLGQSVCGAPARHASPGSSTSAAACQLAYKAQPCSFDSQGPAVSDRVAITVYSRPGAHICLLIPARHIVGGGKARPIGERLLLLEQHGLCLRLQGGCGRGGPR